MYVLVPRLFRRNLADCHDVTAPKLIVLFVPDHGAQAELCMFRFDEGIRELTLLPASAEAFGRTTAQKLEPAFRGKAVETRPGAPLTQWFDQSTGQLTDTSQPIEVLCRSAAPGLEEPRIPQRQLAGSATTFATLTAHYGSHFPADLRRLRVYATRCGFSRKRGDIVN
jgi:hypothetical protein